MKSLKLWHMRFNGTSKDIGTGFFSIIADEYMDIGNKEQLTLCFRWVDEQLDGHEDFLGFYNIPNIASETIVQAIKDSLIRLQLSLSHCRGQCYNGASNMLGKKSGVAKQIQECEAKALPTHCYGHSLSLGVKDATNNCQILSNTMNNTNEIVKLIKYSPKRENLLGELKENLQYEDKEDEDKEEEDAAAAAGLTKFSATRWTVRAICFERVIDNYNVILKLWDECLKTKLQPDIRGRIIGCSTQMKYFEDLYRKIYYEALDLIVSAINERFDQPSFKACHNNINKYVTEKIQSSGDIKYPQHT
jgi:hypothetical protein